MTNEFLKRMEWMEKFSWNMELKAAGMLVREQWKIFREYIIGDRKKFVWTNMLMPPELIYGAGFIPIQTELIAGWLSTLKLSQNCIQMAHRTGFFCSICSYHKAVIGALEAGMLPPPKIAVFSSHLCDGGSLMARYLQYRFQTKVIVLNVPYENNRNASEVNLRGQIDNALKFLEKCGTGEVSEMSLKTALNLSNKGSNLLRKANKIRSKKYLFEGYLALRNMYGASFLLGCQKGADIARAYYEELKQKKEKGRGAPRLLWVHFAPLYDGELMQTFENNLGMKVAFDLTGHIYWDAFQIEKPVEALAKKMLSHFFLGDFSGRKLLYEGLIKVYGIDGIVLFQHQNCRAISCSAWEFREVAGQLNLPYLEISGDCIDSGAYSKAQIRLRMEAFAERFTEFTGSSSPKRVSSNEMSRGKQALFEVTQSGSTGDERTILTLG